MNKTVAKTVLLAAALLAFGRVSAAEAVYLNADANLHSNKPYSEAVRVGNMLYLSGVIGIKPGQTQVVSGGIAAETRQVMENIKATLQRYGSDMDQVVKCTVMLADIADYAAVNRIYVEYFVKHKPARSALAASGLALGALLEVECWALVH